MGAVSVRASALNGLKRRYFGFWRFCGVALFVGGAVCVVCLVINGNLVKVGSLVRFGKNAALSAFALLVRCVVVALYHKRRFEAI